ncbi:MAG TPA: hypothetical protein VGK36_04545 [Candidatus Angelobacter sp.]|jgi:hypothetical protein
MKLSIARKWFSFLFCAVISPQVIGQQQPTSLQKDRHIILPAHPQWENVPTDEAATQPTNGHDKALRQARSEAFNDRLGLAPKLEANNPNMVGVGGTTDRAYIPPLPVDSSAIVVGKVTLAQSHLSADHTAIYTELKVQIESVLQDKAGNLAASGTLDILERGGTVNFQGKTLHHPVSENSGLLDIGQRYVLFLNEKPPALGAFGVTKAWRLNQGHPEPTQAYRADDTENVGRYMSMTESEFTSYVRRAIETHSTR